GKPTRESDLPANTILTWDELGVLAYLKPGSDKIHSVDLALGKQSLPFWPKKLFSGKVAVDGAEVSAQATPQAINRAKKGMPFKQHSVRKSSWRLEHSNTVIILSTEEGGKAGLIGLSISARSK